MIFRFAQEDAAVNLPVNFNLSSMRAFIGSAIDTQAKSGRKRITFDFSPLSFIEPAGVVVLANTIEHFRQVGIEVRFAGVASINEARKYLDDSGFFKKYLGKTVYVGSTVRPTTVPLELFKADNYIPYLYNGLMPWVARSVALSGDTLETIRACIEEVFHNINHHSGVSTGCAFSQHFPNKNRICIAISDFGLGIPARVRTRESSASDQEALRLAVKEGFTTKSNVRNRGVGLSTLIQYITQRNSGTVLIHSGNGYLSATRGASGSSITSRSVDWAYPGTLVHVELRTDTLERLETDLAPEVFQW